MPGLTTPHPRRVRPFMTQADYAARAKRQSDRKAQQYQRARDRQAARAEVELWRWVPAVHAELIRDLVADICAELYKGRPPQQIMSPAAWPAGLPRPDTGLWPTTSEDYPADDPARWRGAGLRARRNAQSRRATARKRAAGLKKVRLVAPEIFTPAVSLLLTQIIAMLTDGLLPTIAPSDPGRVGSSATAQDKPAVQAGTPRTSPAGSSTPSRALAPPTAQRGDTEAPDPQTPQASQAPRSRPARASSPRGIPSASVAIRPNKLPCPDRTDDCSPLFNDIQASWRVFAPGKGNLPEHGGDHGA